MTLPPTTRIPVLSLMCLLAAAGCGDSATEPTPAEPNDPAPGSLAVTVQTTGVEIDADGYTLRVGTGNPISIGVDHQATFTVPAGVSTVLLGDVSAACHSSTGARSLAGIETEVTVAPGGSQTLTIQVTCARKEIVYVRAHSGGFSQELSLMGADGTGPAPLKGGEDAYFWTPTWSPDGMRIAYVSDVGNGNTEIFVMNADGSGDQMICCGPGTGEGAIFDQSPRWSPDGQSIVWTATRPVESESGIYRMSADGTDRVQLTDGFDDYPDWGPDGRIAFTRWTDAQGENNWDLYVMDEDGQNLELLVAGVAAGAAPAWSPDGATIVFTRIATGDNDYTLWSVPSAGGTPVERTDAEYLASFPRWSPDGAQLVYEYWKDGPWPPNAHGLCVGTLSGSTCTPISQNSGQGFFDVWPDWR